MSKAGRKTSRNKPRAANGGHAGLGGVNGKAPRAAGRGVKHANGRTRKARRSIGPP